MRDSESVSFEVLIMRCIGNGYLKWRCCWYPNVRKQRTGGPGSAGYKLPRMALIHDVRHLCERRSTDGRTFRLRGRLKYLYNVVRREHSGIWDPNTVILDVESWSVKKGFLKQTEAVLSGRKTELAEKVLFYRWKLKLKVACLTASQVCVQLHQVIWVFNVLCGKPFTLNYFPFFFNSPDLYSKLCCIML